MGIDINGLYPNSYPLQPKPEAASRDSMRDLNRAVQELQSVSRILNRRLRFSINRQLDQVVVKVIDTRTDKVVKELPPAEVQEMRVRIREAIEKMFE